MSKRSRWQRIQEAVGRARRRNKDLATMDRRVAQASAKRGVVSPTALKDGCAVVVTIALMLGGFVLSVHLNPSDRSPPAGFWRAVLTIVAPIALGFSIRRGLGARERERREMWPARRRLKLPGGAPGVIEVDPTWPGRTRVRIAAPKPLPMLGAARLVPLQRWGVHRGQELRWEGRGATDAEGWADRLRPGLSIAVTAVGSSVLHATLAPQGIILHLPLVLPNRRELTRLEEAGLALAEALADLAEHAAVEGIALSDATLADADCACCWEPVEPAEAVTCERCGARQHADCAGWTGGCARFGCDAAPAA